MSSRSTTDPSSGVPTDQESKNREQAPAEGQAARTEAGSISRGTVIGRDGEPVAYEFSAGREASRSASAAVRDDAAARVLSLTLRLDWPEQAVAGLPVLIPATARLFTEGLMEIPAPHRAVLTILDPARFDEPEIEACRRVISDGSRIAVPQATLHSTARLLTALADFVEVDFGSEDPKPSAEELEFCHEKGCLAIAANVETADELRYAKDRGYDWFHGPAVELGESLAEGDPASPASLIRLAEELREGAFESERLAEIVEQDSGLSHRLSQFADSVAADGEEEGESVRGQLERIGASRFGRWVRIEMIGGSLDSPPPTKT